MTDSANASNESGGFGRVAGEGLDATHGVVLYLEDISVSFDGFKALNKLSLPIDVGELRCIIGPNGAGKTTMMDVITGKTRPDEGTVFFGQTIDLTRLTEARDRARRHRPQVPEADHLRAAQRVREPRAGDEGRQARARDAVLAACLRRRRDRIAEMLELIRLNDSADRVAGLLSHGQKQWLEIGMLLMQEPQAAAARRAGGRHERRGDRAHRASCSCRSPASTRWWWSSTTWRSSRRSRARSRCCTRAACSPRARWTQVQNDPKVIEVYLGR